jgi:hypothetical protein
MPLNVQVKKNDIPTRQVLCEHFGSSDNNVEPPIWWSRKIS